MRARLLAALLGLGLIGQAHAQDAPALEPLGAQRAPAGMCGSYLWSRTPGQRDRDLLAVGTPRAVLVRLSGELRALRLSHSEGPTVAGYPARQRFTDGAFTVELRLTYARPRAPGEAPAIPSGVIMASSRAGWQSITPVSGWVSCTPTAP